MFRIIDQTELILDLVENLIMENVRPQKNNQNCKFNNIESVRPPETDKIFRARQLYLVYFAKLGSNLIEYLIF